MWLDSGLSGFYWFLLTGGNSVDRAFCKPIGPGQPSGEG